MDEPLRIDCGSLATLQRAGVEDQARARMDVEEVVEQVRRGIVESRRRGGVSALDLAFSGAL